LSDFGSTTLGYVIAYVLPGLTAAVAGGFFSHRIQGLFSTVIDEQNIPLGLICTLATITLGLFLSLFRALIFEEWLWRNERLTADEYGALADDDQTFAAYDRVIDESYRFHQFWGGMALALPMLVIGAVLHARDSAQGPEILAAVGLGVLCEIAALWAAAATFKRYLARVRRVLNG
jgi:hypothetical protein